jgi:hypothetical protein
VAGVTTSHDPTHPFDLVEAVLKAAADKRLPSESALRLVFAIQKSWVKGYMWWKRTTWVKHWKVHESTITRDYQRWVGLGFVRIHRHPYKGSAKILIFPWSQAWDEAAWENPEQIASMLPDLAAAYGKKGRTSTTQKGRMRATFSPPNPLSEIGKEKRPQRRGQVKAETTVPPTHPAKQGDEAGLEGAQEMRTLLEQNFVRIRAGHIKKILSAGQAKGLTITGTIAFTADKIHQKHARGDSVYSSQLFITAIGDDGDLHRWARKVSRGHPTYFIQTKTENTPSLPLESVVTYVAHNALALREFGYADLALALEALNLEVLYKDLEKLEQCLAEIEQTIFERLRGAASEDALASLRVSLDSELRPYRGKMTLDQLAMLEKQFMERRLLDASGLPRLSLFYL